MCVSVGLVKSHIQLLTELGRRADIILQTLNSSGVRTQTRVCATCVDQRRLVIIFS
jgi:hypothetical protein